MAGGLPRRRLAALLTLTVCLLPALPFVVDSQISGTVGQVRQGQPRYRVETRETATFIAGQEGKVVIVLLDQYGNRLNAPWNLKTTVTLTRFENLNQAKEVIRARGTNNQMADAAQGFRSNKLSLRRGQQASQITLTHRQGEAEQTIEVLSFETGRLLLFVESEGVATGETSIVVLGSKTGSVKDVQPPGPTVGGAMMVPVAWQGKNARQLKLEFSPTAPQIQPDNGDQIATFRVELKSAGDEYVRAPENLTVILNVREGSARFEPDTLEIRKGEVNTYRQSVLRTRPGGDIKIAAATSSADGFVIAPAERSHKFAHGLCAASLAINKQRDSALANGLDEIEIKVVALQEDGRAITPEEEGRRERIIYFNLEGDSRGVRFENNRPQVRMEKDQQSATIKLFSTRPVGDLKVKAESFNGSSMKITSGDDTLRFSFPLFQLLCAMAGGAVFPLLLKQNWIMVLQGVVLGGVLFGLALFGAIASNPQEIGLISVTLTKLPTESSFASSILGFLGVTVLGAIFLRLRGQGGTGGGQGKAMAKAQGQ